MKKIKTSFKPHFISSLILGIWLFSFIVFTQPFQIEPLTNSQWMVMAFGYTLIAMFGYLIIVPLQNNIFTKTKTWNYKYEISFFLLFYLITLIPSYIFHKSNLINGMYTPWEFIIHVYLPSIVVTTPLIIFTRIYFIKLRPQTEDSIVITGMYKLDYLKIKLSDLVCISSAKNYVIIYFLNNGSLHQKLIRKSLKKLESDIPSLIRVHRSHLINPTHFLSWKDHNTLSLTQMEIPTSKTFKDRLNLI